jgi:hypothetical protein
MALSNSTLNFTTTFEFDKTPKTFKFTDTSTYVADAVSLTTVVGYFEIIDPAGNAFYTGSFASPDVNPDVSLDNSTTITLPLLASGAVQEGTYTITYHVRKANTTTSTNVDVQTTKTFNFAYTSPKVTITMAANCIKPLLTSTDTTNYVVGGITPTIVRDHKLFYPASLELTSINGTGKVNQTSVFYTKQHDTKLTSTLTYAFTNYTVTDSVVGTESIQVDCDANLCDIYCCLSAEYTRYQDNKGVNRERSDLHLNKWLQMMGIAGQIGIALDCSKATDVSSLTADLLKLGNCEPGCGCTGDAPVAVTGLGGTASVSVAVDALATPVTVTSAIVGGVTTYTVGLAAAFVTKVNNSYNATVVGGTDITVTPTTDSNGDKSYSVAYSGTTVIPQMMAYTITITPSVGNVAATTLTEKTRYGTALSLTPTITNENTASASNWQNSNVDLTIAAIWSSQGSRTFKVNAQIVNQVKTKAAITNQLGQRKIYAEIYNLGNSQYSLRIVDVNGIPVTGSKIDGFTSLKIHVQVIA